MSSATATTTTTTTAAVTNHTMMSCGGGGGVRDALGQYSPDKSPLTWVFVNVVMLVASLFAISAIVAGSETGEVRTATGLYYIWNFGSTAVWVVQVTIRMIAAPRHEAYQRSRVKCVRDWIEISLGTYFFLDSVKLIYKWHIKKGQVEEELIDSCLSGLGYLYETFEAYTTFYKRLARSNYAEIPTYPPDEEESKEQG